MKKNLIFFSLFALTLGSLVAGSSLVKAYRGDPNVKGPDYSPQRHEAMTKAFEDNDYSAWKELMQDKGRVTSIINESNFSKFAQAHQLGSQGKLEEAQAIRAQLGLGQRNGGGKGNGGFGKNR
jgi:hypothetical protein